ncbi:MAG: RtcB family protein [Chitinophagales bacterium]
MGKLSLNGKDLRKIGFPESRAIGVAIQVMHQYYKHSNEEDALNILKKVLADPDAFLEDGVLGKIAAAILDAVRPKNEVIPLQKNRLPYAAYGLDHIEPGAINQMEIAMKLPVTVGGALMPDAHQGYGLPIGGVLATDNAVIPYGVGVDIGCRMCLSIFDVPAAFADENVEKLRGFLTRNTVFGTGGMVKNPIDHEVLNRKIFSENALLKSLHERAYRQIGTSGSGNHFVEFGIVEVARSTEKLPVAPGKYLALLSHSGSRGLGAAVANYYTRLARELCKLPEEARHLAYLDLNSAEGHDYWEAMNLSGDYASACHHQIHAKVHRSLGGVLLAMVENHHNFAWKEMHNGKEVIVHRKGATPAGKGVLGIIPGSMTAPGYIVEGRGEDNSLHSASHGAGRKMSRSAAKNSFTYKMLKDVIAEAGVELIGGDIDEAPMAYKDIREVMQSQNELVDVLGIFKPKVVRMA